MKKTHCQCGPQHSWKRSHRGAAHWIAKDYNVSAHTVVTCDIEIWWMASKTTGNLFYAPRSYVCHFIAIHEFKFELSYGNTVGTPYNTVPYITGSNIARLGHGSQNSWSKLWIPVMKSAPVRVIFTWKSVPKKRIHGSSDIYLGTQWKQRHGSPWSYRLDVIVTFLWYGTISIIWHCDHQSTAKKV